MKRLLSIVFTRVGLAVLFAIAVAYLKWRYIMWSGIQVHFMKTPVYTYSLVLIGLLIASALLAAVGALLRNRLSGIRRGPSVMLARLRTTSNRLPFKFVLWGLVIAAGVGAAQQAGFLKDSQFRMNQFPFPGDWVPTMPHETPVKILTVLSGDNNNIKYLKALVKLAKDMKAAGVKAVLAPAPYLFSKQAVGLLEEAASTGIVVFGDVGVPSSVIERGIPAGHMDMDQADRFSFVQRITPLTPPYMRGRKEILDVSFEVLRKYYGFSAQEEARRNGSRVVFGDKSFPLAADGLLYLGEEHNWDHHLHAESVNGITAGYDMEGFFFGYEMTPIRELTYNIITKGKIIRSLSPEQVSESLRGTIVVINWNDISRFNPSPLEFHRYAQILSCMIAGETLTVSSAGSLLLIALCVIVCGLILYRSKTLTAFILLILLSALMLAGGAWLFQSGGILVDIPALVAALAISALVFSVVRMEHEWQRGGQAGMAINVPEPLIERELKSGISFARRRFALSPALGISVIVIVVLLTAVVTSGLQKRQESQQTQPVAVYIMPPVEVQGVVNSPN